MQFYAFPYDRLEGFEAERLEILNHIQSEGLTNEVFFASTDTHATLANVVCTQTLSEADGSYICDRDASPWELVTGPMGTNTYATEINAFTGQPGCAHLTDPTCPSSQVHGFFVAVLAMPCVNLDQISYGHVSVNGELRASSRAPGTGGGADVCPGFEIVVTP